VHARLDARLGARGAVRLFAAAIAAILGTLALFVLSRRPGKLGHFAGILLELVLDAAGGRSRRRSSRHALERAYQHSPGKASEGFDFHLNAKTYFFTKAEGGFYPKLVEAASALDLAVFPKVGLCDVFVDEKDAEPSQRLRYSQMHVDYLLVRTTDYRPVAGIELNGPSHQGEKQQANDRKKKAVFAAARLPLLTFYNQPSYAAEDIQLRLQDILGRVRQPNGR